MITYETENKKDAIDLVEFWESNVRYKHWDVIMVLDNEDYTAYYIHNIESIENKDTDNIFIYGEFTYLDDETHKSLLINRHNWEVNFIHGGDIKILKFLFFDSFFYRRYQDYISLRSNGIHNSDIETTIYYYDQNNNTKELSSKILSIFDQINDEYIDIDISLENNDINIEEYPEDGYASLTFNRGEDWYKIKDMIFRKKEELNEEIVCNRKYILRKS